MLGGGGIFLFLSLMVSVIRVSNSLQVNCKEDTSLLTEFTKIIATLETEFQGIEPDMSGQIYIAGVCIHSIRARYVRSDIAGVCIHAIKSREGGGR